MDGIELVDKTTKDLLVAHSEMLTEVGKYCKLFAEHMIKEVEIDGKKIHL